jgi:hypothetical protein
VVGPQNRLGDIYGTVCGRYRRATVKFIPERKCLTDSLAEALVIRSGEDAVAGIAVVGHGLSLPPLAFDLDLRNAEARRVDDQAGFTARRVKL